MTEIRRARAEDLPGCAAIINDYIDATDWLPRVHPADRIAAMFSAELLDRRIVLVADEGGTIAGYASLDPETRFLPSLYLAPHARGRGVGRAMLHAVKTFAPQGFTLNVWQPNEAARRFYEREGLKLTGEGTDDDGMPIWIMAWTGAGAT